MTDPQKKIYISLVIFLAVAISLIFFGLRPAFSEIRKNSENFIAEKEKISLLKKEKEHFKDAEAIYKGYERDLMEIDKLFINSEFPLEFILFLEENAKNSQIELEISPGVKEKKVDPWPSISFQASTTGSFPDFLRFLERLENSPYLIEILNLNIKETSEEGLDIVESRFLLKVFTE